MVKFTSQEPGVNRLSNTANIWTPILSYTVPAGARVDFPAVTRMILKLYNSSGDEIDDNSRLYWAFKRSTIQDHPEKLTETVIYRPFHNLTLAEQRDAETLDTKISMVRKIQDYLAAKGSNFVEFKTDSIIELYLNSPDVVDWSQPCVLELPDVQILV